ncbi:MAG: SsrA-binding protein SmpB [Eubacteriales bacterium]
MSGNIKIIAKNSKAFHEYYIEDRFEAGMVLAGTEVKSLRLGKVNLKDSYCLVKDGEIWVHGMHISPYEQGNIFNKDPIRPRKLLMHKREIMKLFSAIKQDGYAVVPLKIHFKDSKAKLEIGLAKGKKLHDKRSVSASKDAKREMDRAMKSRNQRY